MIKKLQRKIVLLVLVTCLLLLVIVLGYVFRATNEAMMHDPVNSFEWVLADLRTERYYGVPEGSPRPMAILFVYPDGSMLLSDTKHIRLSDEALYQCARAVMQLEHSGYYQTDDGQTLAYRHEPLNDGRTIVMLTDVSLNQSVLDAFRLNAFRAAAVALLVMVLLGWLFARWVVKPISGAKKAQQDFFAAASHDLKTPLTIILSNIELLTESGEDDPMREQYSRNIRSSADQMKSLILNMLDNITFENMAKEQNTPLNPLDFSYLVQKNLFSFEVLSYEQERSIRYDLEDGLSIRGNADSLDRLVVILLDNALRHSHPHTEIYVRLKGQPNGTVQLDVHSESAPIGKDELERIFQPFYRVDKSRSDQSGYGLGLSIAQNIVASHNGSIFVTTEENTNIFHVVFPRTAG